MSHHDNRRSVSAHPTRLLLIEDNEIDAAFLVRSLRKQASVHFAIDHVCCLKEASQRLQHGQYDLAVIDLSLPDAENTEAFETIRQLDSRLPIVVITGRSDDALALQAIERGAQDFVAKNDLSAPSLVRTLQFAMARQQRVLNFQTAADIDSLTDLPNRRHLENRFAEALRELGSSRQTLAFALLDVDNFKRINDQYGHCTGDTVLKRIAKLLRQRMNERVLASRFGGEEFALLIVNQDIAAAVETVEGILRQLAAGQIVCDDVTLQVTASAGFVEATVGDTWQQVYTRCDGALYAAKTSGKNRCARPTHPIAAPRQKPGTQRIG